MKVPGMMPINVPKKKALREICNMPATKLTSTNGKIGIKRRVSI